VIVVEGSGGGGVGGGESCGRGGDSGRDRDTGDTVNGGGGGGGVAHGSGGISGGETSLCYTITSLFIAQRGGAEGGLPRYRAKGASQRGSHLPVRVALGGN